MEVKWRSKRGRIDTAMAYSKNMGKNRVVCKKDPQSVENCDRDPLPPPHTNKVLKWNAPFCLVRHIWVNHQHFFVWSQNTLQKWVTNEFSKIVVLSKKQIFLFPKVTLDCMYYINILFKPNNFLMRTRIRTPTKIVMRIGWRSGSGSGG